MAEADRIVGSIGIRVKPVFDSFGEELKAGLASNAPTQFAGGMGTPNAGVSAPGVNFAGGAPSLAMNNAALLAELEGRSAGSNALRAMEFYGGGMTGAGQFTGAAGMVSAGSFHADVRSGNPGLSGAGESQIAEYIQQEVQAHQKYLGAIERMAMNMERAAAATAANESTVLSGLQMGIHQGGQVSIAGGPIGKAGGLNPESIIGAYTAAQQWPGWMAQAPRPSVGGWVTGGEEAAGLMWGAQEEAPARSGRSRFFNGRLGMAPLQLMFGMMEVHNAQMAVESGEFNDTMAGNVRERLQSNIETQTKANSGFFGGMMAGIKGLFGAGPEEYVKEATRTLGLEQARNDLAVSKIDFAAEQRVYSAAINGTKAQQQIAQIQGQEMIALAPLDEEIRFRSERLTERERFPAKWHFDRSGTFPLPIVDEWGERDVIRGNDRIAAQTALDLAIQKRKNITTTAEDAESIVLRDERFWRSQTKLELDTDRDSTIALLRHNKVGASAYALTGAALGESNQLWQSQFKDLAIENAETGIQKLNVLKQGHLESFRGTAFDFRSMDPNNPRDTDDGKGLQTIAEEVKLIRTWIEQHMELI